MNKHTPNIKRAPLNAPHHHNLEDDDIEEVIYTDTSEESVMDTTNVFQYLNCPRCQNKRLQDVVTSKTKLKQCPHCQGMWFNLNELEHALGRKVKFTWSKTPEAHHHNHMHKPSCPICQTHLVQIKSLEIPDLVVWACMVCQGRWVDGAEIIKLQKRGLLSALKEFVMRLF
jgi:Zn-finger nucleic acid-binding protein